MSQTAILGAGGAIGTAVGAELKRRGQPHRVVGRDRARLLAAFPEAEIVGADLLNPAAAAEAVRGARTVLHCVGVAYEQFEMHPRIMKNVLDAAIAEGVERVLVVTSVYSYGRPGSERVAENHPRIPASRKGEFRKQQEDLALEAHRSGRIQTLVLHLPDFYGPGANLSLTHPIFEAAQRGRRAVWLGSPDLPHEFVFVPDAAVVIADLLGRDDVWGERWNLGGAGTITGREFISLVFGEFGGPPKIQKIGRTTLQLAGLFKPFLREVAEMFYLQETPVVLDDTRLAQRLRGLHKTPYGEGIRDTVTWLRQRRTSKAA